MSEEFLTRQTLLQKLKSQEDEKSWEEFAQTYRPYIYAIIRNMRLRHHDCEDLVQDVMLKAWDALPTFEYDSAKGKFRSWLAQLTRNVVLNFVTKHSRRLELLEKNDGENLRQFIERVSLPEIEKIAESEWQNYICTMAWKNVSPNVSDKVRAVFELVLEEKSIAEIAEALGIAENTVYRYRKNVQNLVCKEIVRLEKDIG